MTKGSQCYNFVWCLLSQKCRSFFSAAGRTGNSKHWSLPAQHLLYSTRFNRSHTRVKVVRRNREAKTVKWWMLRWVLYLMCGSILGHWQSSLSSKSLTVFLKKKQNKYHNKYHTVDFWHFSSLSLIDNFPWSCQTLTSRRLESVCVALQVCSVTFAAGDLCITVVRALIVATARESSRPWNTCRAIRLSHLTRETTSLIRQQNMWWHSKSPLTPNGCCSTLIQGDKHAWNLKPHYNAVTTMMDLFKLKATCITLGGNKRDLCWCLTLWSH